MTKKSSYNLALFNAAVRGLEMMLIFFLAIHFKNIGLSGMEIGVIFACNTIASIMTIVPSGFSNDKLKSKYLITFSLILLTIQYIGLTQLHSLIPISIIMFIGGIGITFYKASAQSLFYKSANNEQIIKKIGLFQGVSYLTMGIGTIFAGLLLETNFSFPQLFKLIGLGFGLLAAIGLFILPENKVTKFSLLEYKSDLLNKNVLIFMSIVFLFAIHLGAEATSYGLFLKQYLNLSHSMVGFYMGISILSMALTTALLSTKLKALCSKKLLAAGVLISGIGAILMTIRSFETSLLFRIVHEFGDATTFFIIYLLVSKMFKLGRIGGSGGVIAFITIIASTIGALILSPLGEAHGYNWPFIISGITTIIAILPIIPLTIPKKV